MQTFLTKTSVKKVVLLDYLLEKDAWSTIKELQKKLKVTDKSILHYIEELTELFQNYDGIHLLNDENKRFQVKKEEDFPIYTIYLYFYKASYNYQLIDFMYRQPEKSLKDFAEEQFTSISTVFRYAKLLTPYFRRYQIGFQPYKLHLNAKEQEIRCFYYYFYWNSTRENRDSWPFDTELSRIEKYIKDFENVYHLSLEPLQQRIFSYWLAIILERSNVASVTIDTHTQAVIDRDPHFLQLKKWQRESALRLAVNEVYFLYQIIYSFGIIDGNARYENSYAIAHQEMLTCSYRAVENLAVALKQNFHFELAVTDPELLFNFIAFHERSRLFYGNTDLFFNRSYRKEVQAEKPKNYNLVESLHDTLKQQADPDLASVLENWEQLFLNYYFILDYYDLFLSKYPPLKVLIQDDLHHTHRLWLMNKINAYFGHSYTFAFYDYKTKVSEVDLVVSNYYFNTGETPLVLMKNIPTERNWRQFGELVYHLTNQKEVETKVV
ncbi:helix-turn-helix domain-containing protein [Enterococcus durans]|uniref:helix-turn-helix domain-containing protein n=2 Tax=Enterococcus durans TaxID=53345 RepID=UPI00232BDD21|nr:helix-turn-helix domain-containing protein [Enterococcus durans]MDB1652319.1 helix-turn-helix domain-containing protein [Enterococcus durans]MDB1662746.1 helix-turn-helix domain-containing protein [Enterococcus durans]MDB1667889.1 helix-turn-helix domain-containing protein [Enterococcus durans]MDB1670724.1 helix-turn-helix domain-containing protein [Enterococcus durans]MDB1672875.1 helix-turn-helix domain-containing protein [Enterococcus durans]